MRAARAECKFLGPPNGSDMAAQVDLIENAINSGVDAVIMDIPDEKAMEKVTAAAKAKNVGVYFIGTSYPKTKYGSIGQNFYRRSSPKASRSSSICRTAARSASSRAALARYRSANAHKGRWMSSRSMVGSRSSARC